jgi:hypothetical protein
MWLALNPLVEIGAGILMTALALGFLMTGRRAPVRADPSPAPVPLTVPPTGVESAVAPSKQRSGAEAKPVGARPEPPSPSPPPGSQLPAAPASPAEWSGSQRTTFTLVLPSRPTRDSLRAPSEPPPAAEKPNGEDSEPMPSISPPTVASTPTADSNPKAVRQVVETTVQPTPVEEAPEPEPIDDLRPSVVTVATPDSEAKPAAEQAAEPVEFEAVLRSWVEDVLAKTPGTPTASAVWLNIGRRAPVKPEDREKGESMRLRAALEVLGTLAPGVFVLPTTREVLTLLAVSRTATLIWPVEGEAFDPELHAASAEGGTTITAVIRPGLQGGPSDLLKALVSTS